MGGLFGDELKKLARTPGRWRELLRPRRWRQFFSILFFKWRAGGHWQPAPGRQGFERREYASYEEYLRHQQSKLQYLDLTDYDRKYRECLGARLKDIAALRPGVSVLCLGARQGTEVKAFRDLGCSAIGVDLNPGENNPYVVPGDFHNLQYPEAAMDVIFTNSMDHVFDLEKVMAEMVRVLKPGGLLIVEAMRGREERIEPDHYASFSWQKTEDLVALFANRGFKLMKRAAFAEPWPGEQLVFQRAG